MKAAQHLTAETKPVVVQTQRFWLSKTNIINALTILGLLIALAVEMQTALDLPERIGIYLTFANAAINIIVRFYTAGPIEGSPVDPVK